MRVAIANDMKLAVEALRQVVQSVHGYEVCWVAYNGEEAVAMAKVIRPDLVLMDLMMPVMDGIESTRQIMAAAPCPILVVTAHMSNHEKVYEAMSNGALDAVDTPTLGMTGEVGGASPLIEKMAMIMKLHGGHAAVPRAEPAAVGSDTGKLAAMQAMTTLAGSEQSGLAVTARTPAAPAHAAGLPGQPPLILIGASTGGPGALAEVLSELDANNGSAIVIVQHVDLDFAPGLASWLTDQSGFTVELATVGDRPKPGVALLAASRNHLIMSPDGSLSYSSLPRECHYRPSVDVMFQSACSHWAQPSVAVLLTGMGRDGGEGLLQLRERGWYTIAEDESTCVVYGMPRAAAELGAARQVLPLPQIAAGISAYLNSAGRRSQA